VAALIGIGQIIDFRLWRLGLCSMLYGALFPDAPFAPLVEVDGESISLPFIGLLREFQAKSQPIIIRGGASRWPASRKWSNFTYVAEQLGDEPVVLQTAITEQHSGPFIETKSAEFARWLATYDSADKVAQYNRENGFQSTFYMSEEFDVVQEHESMMEDLDHLSAFIAQNDSTFEDGRFETAFWMGGPGARSGWHYDYDYSLNVLVHLVGTKIFTIAPPSQSMRLYPSDRFDSGALLSSVDIFAPDIVKFPEYAKLKSIQITVHAGDVLLVPMGWWHAVESRGATVSVSIRHLNWFENIVNSVDRMKERLHNLGLYGDWGNCVCHADGLFFETLVHLNLMSV